VGALDGRVALVAGASSGIGLATALAFADAGAHVHAAARRVDAIEAAAGDHVVAHALDVGDREAIAQLAREIGSLHALVIAAGINIKRRRFDETSDEDWDRVLATNLTGAFNLMRAFLPALRDTRGDVVVIGSVSGNFTDRSGASYQASKAGVHALARGAAFDEQDGVRFTTVAPGVVDTPILENRPQVPDAEMRAQMLQPEDVAAACLFAVSLPPRAYVPELTILPTALQALGRTS
jgi:NAD(P)-dependent dehydrogenase (short-subunit alcohol dehydrogenase family)